VGLRDAYVATGQDSPVFGGLREAFGGYTDKLLSAAVAVKIDGSDDAKRVADIITDHLEELEANVRSVTPGIQTILSNLIAVLRQAESDLVEAARKDFGVNLPKTVRR